MKRTKMSGKDEFDKLTGKQSTKNYRYWWNCRWARFELEKYHDVVSLGTRDIRKVKNG